MKKHTIIQNKNFDGVFIDKDMWQPIINKEIMLKELENKCKSFYEQEDYYKIVVVNMRKYLLSRKYRVVLASIEYEQDSHLSSAYPIIVNATIKNNIVKDVVVLSSKTTCNKEDVIYAIQTHVDNLVQKENVI